MLARQPKIHTNLELESQRHLATVRFAVLEVRRQAIHHLRGGFGDRLQRYLRSLAEDLEGRPWLAEGLCDPVVPVPLHEVLPMLGLTQLSNCLTLKGSFSAVSKPNFASEYALESSRRDLHNALLCTVL